METVSRKCFYKDEHFFLDYELIGEEVVIHCEANKISPSILRRMFSVFNTFKKVCEESRIKTIIGAPRSPKLAHVFNGEYLCTIDEHEVFKWELKQHC